MGASTYFRFQSLDLSLELYRTSKITHGYSSGVNKQTSQAVSLPTGSISDSPPIYRHISLTSSLYSFCILSLATFWDRTSILSARSCRALAYFPPMTFISSSRRRIPSTASCHCRTRPWRSSCSRRNSSAVLSSSTWSSVEIKEAYSQGVGEGTIIVLLCERYAGRTSGQYSIDMFTVMTVLVSREDTL